MVDLLEGSGFVTLDNANPPKINIPNIFNNFFVLPSSLLAISTF